jgi:predicted nucleic acid-binding protein
MSEFLLTLDTNILLYSVDKDAGVKQYQALEVIERAAIEQTGVLTLQALSEFYFAAVRKGKMPADDARAQVEDWQILFPTIVPSAQTLVNALKVVHEHNIQFWDAMVWAVAKENGVKTLLSEDFQHGRVLGGVRFVNPFLEVAGVAEPLPVYVRA